MLVLIPDLHTAARVTRIYTRPTRWRNVWWWECRERCSSAGCGRLGPSKREKPASLEAGLEMEAGDGLLSHEVSLAVPSALTGLTSVFGMGTGVALSL